MKRYISIFTLCIISTIFLGCNAKEKKALEWVMAKSDYVICADENRHSLYYFSNYNRRISNNYTTIKKITKIDLETGEATPLILNGDNGREISINEYLIPEDKGHNNPNAKFIVKGFASPHSVVVLYDTNTETTTTLNKDSFSKIKGDLCLCGTTKGEINSSFYCVDVYDASINKVTNYRNFTGKIANNDVVVNLFISPKGYVAGSYYYTKYAKHSKYGNLMALIGEINNDNLTISGYNGYGEYVEYWSGKIANDSITGTFTHKNRRNSTIELVEKK
jgi:hypothetical protein